MEPQTEHLPNPFSYTPSNSSHLPTKTEVTYWPAEPKIKQSHVKTERQTDYFLNPFSYSPSEPFRLPVKTEFTSNMPLNPVTPSPLYPQQVHYAPNPSESSAPGDSEPPGQVNRVEFPYCRTANNQFSSCTRTSNLWW